MIEDGLHQLLKLLLQALLIGLPSYTMPEGVSLSLLSAADFVLPLSELALAFGALVAYAVASLSYTLVMRLVKFLVHSG